MTVTPLGHADGGAVVSHSDITERVLSEASSRQDTSDCSIALSAAQMGVWSLDVANGELSYSPRSGRSSRGRASPPVRHVVPARTPKTPPRSTASSATASPSADGSRSVSPGSGRRRGALATQLCPGAAWS